MNVTQYIRFVAWLQPPRHRRSPPGRKEALSFQVSQLLLLFTSKLEELLQICPFTVCAPHPWYLPTQTAHVKAADEFSAANYTGHFPTSSESGC